jgi:hypothetical protein
MTGPGSQMQRIEMTRASGLRTNHAVGGFSSARAGASERSAIERATDSGLRGRGTQSRAGER